MTTFTMRRVRDHFVVTGLDIEPMKFKGRPEARDWCKTHHPGSPIREIGPGTKKRPPPKVRKAAMADLKTLFSEEAAQCRRLAEIATEQGIKEKLLEMAARFQAMADGDNDEQ